HAPGAEPSHEWRAGEEENHDPRGPPPPPQHADGGGTDPRRPPPGDGEDVVHGMAAPHARSPRGAAGRGKPASAPARTGRRAAPGRMWSRWGQARARAAPGRL